MGGRGEGGAAMKCEVPNAASQGTSESERAFFSASRRILGFSALSKKKEANREEEGRRKLH